MILVVGATGTLGGIITRRLLAQGREVRVLIRQSPENHPLVLAGAQAVAGDLKDRKSLDAACQGIDTVITTANSARRGGEDNSSTVEDQGNRNLIEAARDAGVRQFIFMSASGADPNSPYPFLAGKGKAEQLLMESGMQHTILAPVNFAEVWLGIVIAAPIARGLPVTLYRGAEGKTNFIATEDVAAFTVAAMDHPAAANQKLWLGGPRSISFPEAVEIFQRLLGRGIDVQYVDHDAVIPAVPPAVRPIFLGSSLVGAIAPTEDLAETMGVTLTPPEVAIQNMLAAIPIPGGDGQKSQ